MYAGQRLIPALVIFATASVVRPEVRTQGATTCTARNETTCTKNESSCIGNYAELKQALFDSGTGNMERRLYTFTPTNNPIPHYVWVFYFHNESTDWQDILTCPSSNDLERCPTSQDVTGGSDSYGVLYWADSPLLINMDIPLLKFLSYNSILQYLGKSACVQLVIPPFCDSVDSQLAVDILKFATSYVSYINAHYTELYLHACFAITFTVASLQHLYY